MVASSNDDRVPVCPRMANTAGVVVPSLSGRVPVGSAAVLRRVQETKIRCGTAAAQAFAATERAQVWGELTGCLQVGVATVLQEVPTQLVQPCICDDLHW